MRAAKQNNAQREPSPIGFSKFAEAAENSVSEIGRDFRILASN